MRDYIGEYYGGLKGGDGRSLDYSSNGGNKPELPTYPEQLP